MICRAVFPKFKTNQINKPLAQLINKKGKKTTKINRFKDEKRYSMMASTEIKIII